MSDVAICINKKTLIFECCLPVKIWAKMCIQKVQDSMIYYDEFCHLLIFFFHFCFSGYRELNLQCALANMDQSVICIWHAIVANLHSKYMVLRGQKQFRNRIDWIFIFNAFLYVFNKTRMCLCLFIFSLFCFIFLVWPIFKTILKNVIRK